VPALSTRQGHHNIWDNATDIVVLWSYLALLNTYLPDPALQWAMAGVYLTWQLLIKPLEGEVGKGLQALFALGIGTGTIFLYKGALGIAVMMALGWLVAYISAHHFLVGGNDSLRRLLASVWALLATQFVWIFSHWLVLHPFFNGRLLVPQGAVVITVLGYIFGAIYLDHTKKLLGRKRLFWYLGTIGMVTLILVIGSEWVAQL
jgi:hypothetical protein